METVTAMEENEALKYEDSCAIIRTSSDSSKQIADPVVYQLVRVEGDGRLVPATDDEVMEVEDLLDDDDKSVMRFVLDADPPSISPLNDEPTSAKVTSNDCEGLLEYEDTPAEGERSNAAVDTTVDLGKLNAQFEEIAPSPEPTSNGGCIVQSGAREKSDPQLGLADSEPSTSTVCGSWKPDFSKLKGEICLDNLSVRELHETFKATFGRETSVKDKQWLKRRIAMGLSNSCDVSTTTFIIEDNSIKKKFKLEDCNSRHTKDPVVGGMSDSCDNVAVGPDNQMENHLPVNSKSSQGAKPMHDLASEDVLQELRAAKRVRKPTRRYIEEASESDCRESGGRLVSSVKNSGHGRLTPRAHVRPFQNIQPIRRPLVTRQDSLGGSGVEIPYVSRIRRGRPRENFMALMKFQPCGMSMEAALVKKALDGHGTQSDYETENNESKARLAPGWVQHPLMKEQEENAQYTEQSMELNNDVDVGVMDSSADDSDDNIVTVPTAKGGMRRKHHRPWTLSEVVKLVEGVARYGAGRWSEIKRIAFATYSYRTSVDLKDKWRNLLRASFAQLPAEKGATFVASIMRRNMDMLQCHVTSAGSMKYLQRLKLSLSSDIPLLQKARKTELQLANSGGLSDDQASAGTSCLLHVLSFAHRLLLVTGAEFQEAFFNSNPGPDSVESERACRDAISSDPRSQVNEDCWT